MSYRTLLIFLITLMLCPLNGRTQEERYRVEILVLSHLDYTAEAREYKNLDDYSQSIDFLTPVPEEEESEETNAEGGDEAIGELDSAGATQEDMEQEPPRIVHIEEMSELMKENWRRLRLSAPFRPQQYLSWEQAADEPFPALRMHNLELVLMEDPYAEQRALLEEAPESETEETDSLPEPTYFYQLDGTITLRRTRFLHLDVRLDWREPMYDPDAEFEMPEVTYDELSGELQAPGPDSFLVYRLDQSRQVKTGQLEYFDHPVLGVLAYISRIAPVAQE